MAIILELTGMGSVSKGFAYYVDLGSKWLEFSNHFSEGQNLKEVRLFFRDLAVVKLMEVLVILWAIGRLLYCHGADYFMTCHKSD